MRRFVLEEDNAQQLIKRICARNQLNMKYNARVFLAVTAKGTSEVTQTAQFILRGLSHFLQHYPNLDVNSHDSTGRTPLLRAVGGGCDKTVWVLLSRFNADAQAIDAKGRSAIRYILTRVINTCGQKSNMLNISAIFAYFNTKISSEDIFYATQRMNCLEIALLFLKHSAEFSYVQGLVNNSDELRLHEMKVKKMVPEKSHPFLTFLKSQIGHVSSLKEFCRALIRKEIGVGIVRKVSELQLPKRMQEYVLIPELREMVQRYMDDSSS